MKLGTECEYFQVSYEEMLDIILFHILCKLHLLFNILECLIKIIKIAASVKGRQAISFSDW